MKILEDLGKKFEDPWRSWQEYWRSSKIFEDLWGSLQRSLRILLKIHSKILKDPHGDLQGSLRILQRFSPGYTQLKIEVVVLGNCVRGGNLWLSTHHKDHKAICIVSYPVYHHSYPAAHILGSITALGVSASLELVVVAWIPHLRVRLCLLFLVVFVPVTFFLFSFLEAFLTLFWPIHITNY